MSHTISDLHNSIDALQNEKASLLSIIRLLQTESTVNNNANYSHSAYQKFRMVNLSTATVRQLKTHRVSRHIKYKQIFVAGSRRYS